MDEPGWAWPAWKFGMKRDDLFGRLHAQYNTFASTIQDPEAFHHDVYEISMAADTIDSFHRLMAQRQAQRLRELNETLESAAIEIIANPKLIGSDQWQYALQLFRTKSFDSLVRYFASYLPMHPDDDVSSRGSSFAETCSVTTQSSKPSTIDDLDGPIFFTDIEDKPLMTHEPLSIVSSTLSTSPTKAQMPLSPARSMTVCSDASVSSCSDDIVVTHEYHIAPTPARSMSFSGSESGRFIPCERGCHRDESEDDEALSTSQSDFGTPLTCELEAIAASHSSLESISEVHVTDFAPRTHEVITIPDDDEDDIPPAQLPCDVDVLDDDERHEEVVAETPTPRQESTKTLTSFLEEHHRSASKRTSSPRSARLLRRRDGSPNGSRRSPEESMSRVQKATMDPLRTRPRGRRRVATVVE